jgi:hypothetical protein
VVAALGEHIRYNHRIINMMMKYVQGGLRSPNGIATEDEPKAIGSVLQLW